MKVSRRAPPANRLLAALSARSRKQFLASCDHLELEFGQVLCEAGERVRYVYFPTDSFISLVTTLEDGARLEVGIIGNEGMHGISLMLGVDMSPQHAIVQGAGAALRMSAVTFSRHLKENAALRQILNCYVYVLMVQISQIAACTHYHLVEARLARWLLMTRDRAHSNRFHLTHEFLAYMLGVRRVGITQAASALQKRRLISYSRGEIVVLDGTGLEKASCKCYGEGIKMYDRTLRPRRGASRRH